MSIASENQSQQVNGLPIQQIVVAVDLSASSEKTVAYAIAIARSFGARIHLVYVQAPESITESRRSYRNCGADFRVGTCADEVSRLARTLDADLIITASHHTSFLNSLLNLQQAPKIMHRAPCSVLVYHDQKALGAIHL